MKIKTTNALMKYLRDTHNISIGDSKDKRNLINIGYYHGYKGYRYINNPQNRIKISNFNEIVSIVDFDSKLKSLLYPQIMQIETISKNIVLQLLVEEYKTDEFNEIYENGMTDYRSATGNEYKKRMKHRMSVQNNIYSSLSRSYNNNNKIVSHFYSKDKHVPIWAIFEIITLGTFADLIKSLEIPVRRKIDKEMKINVAFDTNAKFPEKIMYLIKSLRNSIAHNDVVFDVRFKDGNVDTILCKYFLASALSSITSSSSESNSFSASSGSGCFSAPKKLFLRSNSLAAGTTSSKCSLFFLASNFAFAITGSTTPLRESSTSGMFSIASFIIVLFTFI